MQAQTAQRQCHSYAWGYRQELSPSVVDEKGHHEAWNYGEETCQGEYCARSHVDFAVRQVNLHVAADNVVSSKVTECVDQEH